MTTELQNLQAVVTMDSRIIAEITGKRHDHVMTDCKKLENYYLEIYSPEKSGELMKQQLTKIHFKEHTHAMNFPKKLFLT